MEFASVPSEHREIRLKEWISRYSDDVLRTCFVLLSDRTLAGYIFEGMEKHGTV